MELMGRGISQTWRINWIILFGALPISKGFPIQRTPHLPIFTTDTAILADCCMQSGKFLAHSDTPTPPDELRRRCGA